MMKPAASYIWALVIGSMIDEVYEEYGLFFSLIEKNENQYI
jgi:hypothetical protein